MTTLILWLQPHQNMPCAPLWLWLWLLLKNMYEYSRFSLSVLQGSVKIWEMFNPKAQGPVRTLDCLVRSLLYLLR